MDAEDMKFPAGIFDVITAVQTAHHWSNPSAVLDQIHRVLKPGGRFYLYEADRNQTDILDLFARDLSAKEALRAFHRWRIFVLACSETFGLHKGQEWWVSHYLFKKP